MKVLDFNLRTPGIFLQHKKDLKLDLFLEVWQGDREPEDYTSNSSDDWKDINEVEEIKVLADVPEPDDIERGELRIQELKVPYQNTGTVSYKLLVPDGKTWYYRIVAVPCVECYKTYPESVIDEESVKVLVGKGSFKS